MNYLSLSPIAFVLSLDAFSVAISCGIKLKEKRFGKYFKISLTFALFQAFMPLGGYVLGLTFKSLISSMLNWVSFIVFFVLGLKSIFELFKKEGCGNIEGCNCNNNICLLSLGVATSIDAFLIGIVLSFYEMPFYVSLSLIGATTFVMSFVGCLIGYKASKILKRSAHLVAAIILFILAIKSIF